MSEFPPEETSFPSASVIPHNREAEEAVVGAVLINPEVYYDLAQFLQADDFYIHRHRWIWEAFNRLHEQRIPIDFLTVTEELERAGQLAEIGGPAYLTALLNQVPTSLHAEAYGRMVEAAAIRRRLLTAANQIATLAYNEQETVENVIEEAEKHLFNVSERRLRHDVRPIASVLSEYYDRIDELARRPEEIFGVPTGFIDLDRMLTGMQPSDLLIIAGRPGQGKSGFLLSVAKNAALLHKKHVAVFSLEMSNEQVVQRLLAQQTGIDSQRLRNGKLNEDEWPLLTEAIDVLEKTHIYLDDTPAITPLQLRTKCRRLHMEIGLDLIIIDYLQLMGGDTRTENRVQEVSYISRNLKALARELDVPVLAAAQLSRAVEQRTDKRPVLSDLRESGCLTGDTLIPLENGRHVPIRELEGKSDFKIWALNPNTLKLEAMPVSRAFCTGIKPVFRMRTRLGREIRATGNHKFLTIQGWKRLDELTAGDYLALPRILPAGQVKQTMPDSELALLGHLIGDGCTLPRHVIQYTTREKDLADLVASLAEDVFGNEVQPRIVPQRRWYPVYLSSTRHHTHHVHSQKIGAVGEYKRERLAEILRHANQRVSNTNRDVIPHNVWRMHVVPAMQQIGMSTRQMQAALETQYCGTALDKQNASRERTARVAEAVKSDELARLSESDIYWDSIVSIEPDGEEQVYDLTVPSHHNFIANNIIVHNSLEQDADVVMFIYRPDQYEKDTEKQNLAEIIVAKHRNGPTGSVELVFMSHLTKFLDAVTKKLDFTPS